MQAGLTRRNQQNDYLHRSFRHTFLSIAWCYKSNCLYFPRSAAIFFFPAHFNQHYAIDRSWSRTILCILTSADFFYVFSSPSTTRRLKERIQTFFLSASKREKSFLRLRAKNLHFWPLRELSLLSISHSLKGGTLQLSSSQTVRLFFLLFSLSWVIFLLIYPRPRISTGPIFLSRFFVAM